MIKLYNVNVFECTVYGDKKMIRTRNDKLSIEEEMFYDEIKKVGEKLCVKVWAFDPNGNLATLYNLMKQFEDRRRLNQYGYLYYTIEELEEVVMEDSTLIYVAGYPEALDKKNFSDFKQQYELALEAFNLKVE